MSNDLDGRGDVMILIVVFVRVKKGGQVEKKSEGEWPKKFMDYTIKNYTMTKGGGFVVLKRQPHKIVIFGACLAGNND